MKLTATIFLLVILASVQTPIGQIFKLPLLIGHFLKHQKQEGISLFHFLEDHYATKHNDADLPEDEDLPFKNISFYSIGNVIEAQEIPPHAYPRLHGVRQLGFTHTYTPHQHLNSIFHPPRN